MNYLYAPSQCEPYDVVKRFINSKESKIRKIKYIEIISDGFKISDLKEIIKKLKEISEKGCTYAFVTNAIMEQYLKQTNNIYDDEHFKKTFNFSLKIGNTNNLDYNYLMLDIYSSIGEITKFTIFKYDVRKYNSYSEATKELLNKDFDNTTDAILALVNNNPKYTLDGIDSKGKIRIKKVKPESKTIFGTYSDLARQLFGLNNKKITKEEFDELCKKNEIDYVTEYERFDKKFSGLTETAINTWVNYYFQIKNIPLTFESTHIINDFNNYHKFMDYINDLANTGYTVGISAGPGKDVVIQHVKEKTKEKVTTKQFGHRMTFRYFNEQGDMVVDSWGEDYIIKKDYYNLLSIKKVLIKPVVLINNDINNTQFKTK